MRRLEDDYDTFYFLNKGVLTSPFVDSEQIEDSVRDVYKDQVRKMPSANMVTGLIEFVHSVVKNRIKANANNVNKFNRTAEDVFDSRKTIDANDYTLLFATFARQLRIPTTCLFAVEKNKLQDIVERNNEREVLTKSFCECYYDDQWILVDPEKGIVNYDYNPNSINVLDEKGKEKNYAAYYRGLDFGMKQSIEDLSAFEKRKCRSITYAKPSYNSYSSKEYV